MELKPDVFTALMWFGIFGIMILILTPIPMCGFFFPHTKQFFDTSCVCYNSTQF